MRFRLPVGTMARWWATILLALAWGSAGAGESGRQAPTCKPPGRQAIELHVYATSDGDRNLRRLAARLKRDGFKVLFTKDGGDGLSPLVSVQAVPSRFRQVFGVRLENGVMARSATDGRYCQLRVVRLTIPKRYRGLVDDIQVPDPQLD
jgi:hypothetical protein